jgi:hypothetical protein
VTDKIVPPPELVNQWCHEDGDEIKTSPRWFRSVCAKAAQWGADRPDGTKIHTAVDLKIARRPSPPSLKQQALAVLNDSANRLDGAHENTIRRALEALDE